jgi:hypothetical protein
MCTAIFVETLGCADPQPHAGLRPYHGWPEEPVHPRNWDQTSRAFERSLRIAVCFLLPDQQQRRNSHAAQLLIRKTNPRAPISASTMAAPIIPNPTQRRICFLELFFFSAIMRPPHAAHGAISQTLWYRSLLGRITPSESLLPSCFVCDMWGGGALPVFYSRNDPYYSPDYEDQKTTPKQEVDEHPKPAGRSPPVHHGTRSHHCLSTPFSTVSVAPRLILLHMARLLLISFVVSPRQY